MHVLAALLPATVDDLGLVGALDLGALIVAQRRRMPVAPTRRMTVALMGRLRETGLIDVPWPEPRWEVAPEAPETPIEGLQWRMVWQAYLPDGIEEASVEFLRSIPRDDYGIALRLRLWRELVVAEGERYLEYQLSKHQFDPTWAQDLVFLQKEHDVQLSAAQWRYCAWAAARQGGSLAQQLRFPDPVRVREAIFNDLRRRLGPVASGQWTNTSFVPQVSRPDSALSMLFATELTSLGSCFWSVVPNELALAGSGSAAVER